MSPDKAQLWIGELRILNVEKCQHTCKFITMKWKTSLNISNTLRKNCTGKVLEVNAA